MSGFEIAGVVLGAIPLIISALENYKASRSALAAIVKYHGQLDRLLYKLKIQQTALYFDLVQLLRNAEIEEVEERADISPGDCLLIVQSQRNGAQLQKYLGTHYDTFLDILKRYEQCLKKIAKKLKHIQRLPHASKDDLAALLEANPLKKGHFEFHKAIVFSIERGTLATLIEELDEDHLNLKVIIKGMKTERENCAKSPSRKSKRLSRTLSQVSASAKALYLAMCQRCSCVCQNNHKVFLELHNRMSEDDQASPAKGVRGHSLTFNLVFEVKPHFLEAFVKANNYNILDTSPIYNKGRHVSFQDTGCSSPKITISNKDQTQNITSQAPGICDLISQGQTKGNILTLELEGKSLNIIQGPHQIQRGLSQPTTLETLLRRGAADKNLRMTPTQQSLLALDIASSVLQLRQSCWSQPAFSSKIVKCILGANGSSPRQVSITAFIEQVTELSRAALPGPEPKVTLLELAILLLEIWNHETLEMWAANVGFDKTTTTSERLEIATKWLEETTNTFTLRYLEAIEQCLALCVQRRRQWDDSELQALYCENVIKPLQENIGIWPPSG
ncbi:hypothetical protein F4777DRAFT_595397 [Nemania sp. FL0916]|nr:hypothetical protein F4777DRAFT_595397 [Nemania sp. FL0916]